MVRGDDGFVRHHPFTRSVVHPFTHMALIQQLATLEHADLIRLAQSQPELAYLFRHALVQEAAYQTLVKQDRRHLHRIVGETLEHAYPERLDELSPLLAHHFYEAGDHARALKYFTQ